MTGSNSISAEQYPWWKIALWTLAFQLAWNWRSLGPVLQEGELVGPDDFLRLNQILNWLAGQDWYDLRAYRMYPPDGADIHWSRLVDLPVAGLTAAFGTALPMETAWRLAAILWPTLLAIATVWVLVLICDRLLNAYNRLLTLLFSVLCTSSIAEFVPGRIDHHNIQILLFVVVLLGLVMRPSWKGDLLIGAGVALSISIGLDSAILLAPILGFVALEWAWGLDHDGKGLRRAGMFIGISSLILYALNFPPERWLEVRCDANSRFYLSALLLVAAAFVVLPVFSRRIGDSSLSERVARLIVCAAFGAAAVGILLILYPQCASGPFSEMDPELKTRWLIQIEEAKGLVAAASDKPSLWFASGGYMLVMLAVATYVTVRRAAEQPRLLVLYLVLLICTLSMFVQIRMLRVGAYAAIPFCVIAATLSWRWLQSSFPNSRTIAGALQTIVVILMLSASWQFAGSFIEAQWAAETTIDVTDETSKDDGAPGFCNAKSDFSQLNALPPGYVMSSLNIGSVILIHTDHQVVGGNYHRNENAILAVKDFFETDARTARQVTDELGFDYVALCPKEPAGEIDPSKGGMLMVRVLEDRLPDWLEWISSPDAKLKLLRVNQP